MNALSTDHRTRYSRASQARHLSSPNLPLTIEQITEFAPSILTETSDPTSTNTASFATIPTLLPLQALMREGWNVHEVRQTLTKQPDRRAYAKHLIRLRHPDTTSISTQDEQSEVILINANNGTQSYRMMQGVIRFLCDNGLIAGDITADKRIVHSRPSTIVDRVLEASFALIEEAPRTHQQVTSFKSIELSAPEARALAEAALELRWPRDPDTNLPTTKHTPQDLLTVRRQQDLDPSLWTTFNVIQENLLEGHTRKRIRSVSSVSANVALNRSLWTLATKMAEIKGVH